MNKLDVRIVTLEPVRVAAFHAFGPEPEHAAWQKLEAWAAPLGYLADTETHPIFGFNNPNPSPGSPNYGYEFWIVVGAEEESSAAAPVKEFGGGLYAVTRCEVGGAPGDTIPATWQELVAWREDSAYRIGNHQWLEKHIPLGDMAVDQFDLDLYMPIAK
ncbi:MAG: GyrI-like domain-containing protein [Caldilineaceae bacterium]|nr:GyrI-like domain-containing protein [Caldilineaceae bacterium]